MATKAATPASTTGTPTKVALIVGVGIALAAAHTKAAPLVVVILAAAIVYQLLTL